jgi:hypothetical protein
MRPTVTTARRFEASASVHSDRAFQPVAAVHNSFVGQTLPTVDWPPVVVANLLDSLGLGEQPAASGWPI